MSAGTSLRAGLGCTTGRAFGRASAGKPGAPPEVRNPAPLRWRGRAQTAARRPVPRPADGRCTPRATSRADRPARSGGAGLAPAGPRNPLTWAAVAVCLLHVAAGLAVAAAGAHLT